MGTLILLAALGGAFLSGAAVHAPAQVPSATPGIRLLEPGDIRAGLVLVDQLDCRVLDEPVIYRDLSPAPARTGPVPEPAAPCRESCPHD